MRASCPAEAVFGTTSWQDEAHPAIKKPQAVVDGGDFERIMRCSFKPVTSCSERVWEAEFPRWKLQLTADEQAVEYAPPNGLVETAASVEVSFLLTQDFSPLQLVVFPDRNYREAL